jgi:probable phosphoglycerate mutase
MLTTDPTHELIGYIVRHGELNIDNKWDGWGKFVLSDEGQQSAKRAGEWLGYKRIGRMVSSDLPRAAQTADIISNEISCECPYIATDPNLRAWAIGDFTGKEKTDERKEEFQYYRDHPAIAIPGGESFDQFCERVKVAFTYLCSPYKALPTVIVCHNSVLKGLMGLDEKGDVVTPGGIVGVYLDDKGECHFQILVGATDMDKDAGLESSCG